MGSARRRSFSRARSPLRRRFFSLWLSLALSPLPALAEADGQPPPGAVPSEEESRASVEAAPAPEETADPSGEESEQGEAAPVSGDSAEQGEPAAARVDVAAEPPQDEGIESETREEVEGEGSAAHYVLESIEVRGNRRTREAVILREIALRPGEVLDLDDPRAERARYRLLATGFFSEVRLSLRRGSRRGRVVLVVEVVERWTLVVHDVALGVSEIATYGGLDFGETNFLGLGIGLSAAFVASAEQQAYRIRVGDPRFLDSDWSLSAEFIYNDARDFLGRRPVLVTGLEGERAYALVEYSRIGGSIGTGVWLSPTVRVSVDYRLEVIRSLLPAAAAQLGGTFGRGIGEPIDFHLLPGRSILSTFVASLDHDTRDHAFLPSRGRRIASSVSLASDVAGSSYHYVKLTVEADFYVPLPWRHTIHFGLLSGTIFGDAPLFELYFVGDFSNQVPSRVLDLNFSHAPPPNVFRTSVEEMRYENLAAKLDVEYIVPLYRGSRIVYGLDFFLLLGVYAIGSPEDFVARPTGYPGGYFPIDLTLDLGFRLDSVAGVFGFSFQNLLGLIPFNEE